MPAPDSAGPAPIASSRASLWLALGAAAGLACAAAGLLASAPGDAALPADAVASVNGVVIGLDAWDRAVEGLAADRRGPIGAAERRHVLERMLDEELLVQRGIELGLAQHDRRVRGDLVAAVIELVVSQADGAEPDPADVRAFYDENRAYFTPTERVRVRALLVRGAPQRPEPEARARAEEAARRLRAGEAWEAVAAALGDPQVAPAPDDLLPPAKLREYLGSSAAGAVAALEEGGVSEPVRAAAGHLVLQLVERAAGVAPPLSEVEAEVRAELRRRADDRALRAYLDDLREQADLRVREEVL